jgi:micrococcal nuclease
MGIVSNQKFKPPKQMYQYFATVTAVHDGDTFKATVDLGFTVKLEQTFRMFGINAPELKGDTKEAAILSRDELRRLILGKRVVIQSYKPDSDMKQEKYGRFLAKVTVDTEYYKSYDVNEHMVINGFAVSYMAE